MTIWVNKTCFLHRLERTPRLFITVCPSPIKHGVCPLEVQGFTPWHLQFLAWSNYLISQLLAWWRQRWGRFSAVLQLNLPLSAIQNPADQLPIANSDQRMAAWTPDRDSQQAEFFLLLKKKPSFFVGFFWQVTWDELLLSRSHLLSSSKSQCRWIIATKILLEMVRFYPGQSIVVLEGTVTSGG